MQVDKIIQDNKHDPNYIIIDENINSIDITKSGKYHFIYNYNKEETKKVSINISKNIEVTIYEYHDIHKIEGKTFFKINYDILENTNVNYISVNNNLLEMHKKINFDISSKSNLKTYSLEIGNNSTNEYNINLNEEGSSVNFNLMVYADRDILKKYLVSINHLKPYTHSVMNNHGVINNQSNCIFDVKSFIKKASIKSEAYQSSKVLTLSDNCNAKINPQLLIEEHDVMGSHAATYGRISDEVMYYMQSRGINKIFANQLIAVGNLLKNAPEDLLEILTREIEKRISHE